MSDARKLLNALGGVDEKFIEEAAEPEQLRRKKPNWKVWGGCVAAAIAVAVGVGALTGGMDLEQKSTASLSDVRELAASVPIAEDNAASPIVTATTTAEAAMEDGLPMENAEVKTETTSEEAASDGALILASVDNSEYIEKCVSNGLTAGAPQYPATLTNPEAAYDFNDPDMDYEAYSKANEEYYQEKHKRVEETEGYEIPLMAFTETTARQFLADQEDNTVYSPVNVYMALSMLAELTDGESRQQILDLLDMPDIESVREEARKLWLANYTNDGLTTLLLGSGAWISDDFSFNQEALDTLVDKYYAFYVVGDMSSDEMNQSFRDWLSEQTMGLLDDFVSEEKFDPETIMALATTIYYKAHWQDVFQESDTEDAVFHGANGDETVPFMNEKRSGTFIQGENFTSVSKPMAGNETMEFFLPDEGTAVDDLLASDEFWSVLEGNVDSAADVSYGCIITMSVPKFDVSSGRDLIDGLQELGVKDVFDSRVSDFSTLSPANGIYVGKVSHNARVKIDEEGVEAAAYTAMLLCGATMPTKYADFICDRPFIFAIKNYDGAVLFMGTVNSIK